MKKVLWFIIAALVATIIVLSTSCSTGWNLRGDVGFTPVNVSTNR